MNDKIGLRMLEALKDCNSFQRGNYFWKRQTMKRAVELGLAEEVTQRSGYQSAFALTDAGREILRKHALSLKDSKDAQ